MQVSAGTELIQKTVFLLFLVVVQESDDILVVLNFLEDLEFPFGSESALSIGLDVALFQSEDDVEAFMVGLVDFALGAGTDFLEFDDLLFTILHVILL